MAIKYHILVAEDEDSSRNTLLQDLEVLIPDAVFQSAADGCAAAAQAKEMNTLHIAFLDIRMPKQDGLETAHQIRRLHRHCQIIFISAFHDFSYMQEALELGAVNYLLRPFSKTELAASVQKALAQISNYRKIQESAAQIQSQVKRFSQFADSQLLINIVNGQQNTANIKRHFEQMNIHFHSGMYAVLRCPNGMRGSRITGLLRGNDWGETMKLMQYEQQSHIFILAVASTPQSLSPGFPELLTEFCQKAESLLHFPLSCSIGEEFMTLSDAQKKYFDCYYQLLYDTPYQIFPYSALDSGGIPSEPQEYTHQICAFQSCAKLLGIKPNRVCRNILHSLSDAMPQFGIPAKNAQEILTQAEEFAVQCQDYSHLAGFCQSLCNELKRLASPRSIQRGGRENIRPLVEEWVEMHYADNISLETAAVSMQYAPAYFSKLFKRLFHQTFTSYLTNVRMEHAKQLLRTSDDSIHNIADAVGFRDSTYFTRAFRRLFGCTPTEYRSNERKSPPPPSGTDPKLEGKT